MKVAHARLTVRTRKKGLFDFTAEAQAAVAKSGVRSGLCTAFIRHTSASLLIQENADPSVQRDLERWLEKLAPEGADYEHNAEGPDDMPAHLRAAVLPTSLQIPIVDGHLSLGTWQGLYVCEHRSHPHERTVELTLIGT